ncbi:MAG: hypothetical protein ABI539_02245, partial [Acidobacteriota bacterium]
PKAGFLQWRARMTPGTVAASLTELNVAYQPFNIAPEVLSIAIHPTNVGLLSNPPPQIDPNIELSGLDPAAFGVALAAIPPRRVYQRAARALQWRAEDRNGDKLTYDLYFKEAGDADWKILKRDLTDAFYTIDGLTLADGRYTVRIVARDTPSNPVGKDLSGDRISEPFDIDNGQPTVTAGAPTVTGEKARVVFSASDRSGYLSRAEYSINGGEWLPVYADDGISDGPEERYTVEIPVRSPGEHSITIRVYDASGNAGNARAVVRK